MHCLQNNSYAEWRVRCGAVPRLRDNCDFPPESILQSVWQHQRLQREQLMTTDGQPVRVLHPGFRSVEGGPDFRDAVVQIGDAAIRCGDIEVDLRSSGWHAHGHDSNPAFLNVVLQVIWESERPAAGAPPTLPLRGLLDAPLGELSLWLGSEAARELPKDFCGRCCAALSGLAAPHLGNLLHQAAQVRLRSKAARFQARARQAGWDQALWEGMFAALGYKHNTWPMQRLAELRPRWRALSAPAAVPASSRCEPPPGAKDAGISPKLAGRDTAVPGSSCPSQDILPLQARLLGLSGLLPAELTRSQAGIDEYLRRVWDFWWRERDEFADCALPRSLWRFHGLRPANHPQRRLALASHWSAAGDLASRLEQWCRRNHSLEQWDESSRVSALPASLLEVLQVETKEDDFWSWHWTLRSARMRHSQPLLGLTRVTDLAVNVVLPWLWIRAVEGRNEPMQRSLEARYFAWPAAEDNSLLRHARQRLLGGAARGVFPGAAAQQGMIQILRDFCEHSNALCEGCKLPEWTGAFGR